MILHNAMRLGLMILLGQHQTCLLQILSSLINKFTATTKVCVLLWWGDTKGFNFALSADGVRSWGSWSPCSATCGTGTRTRTALSCQGPFYAGMPCSGSGTDTESCQGELLSPLITYINAPTTVTNIYAVEGTWTTWEPWGACSSSCGIGTQSRTRNFTGGMPCIGNKTDAQNCQSETK